MMRGVHFEVMTMAGLRPRRECYDPFDLWNREAPGSLPDRHDMAEPISQIFDISALPDKVRRWYDESGAALGILLKRRLRPKFVGCLAGPLPVDGGHSTWTINFNSILDFDVSAFVNLLRLAAVEYEAEFSFIHSPTDLDIENGRVNGVALNMNKEGTKRHMFVTTHDLQRYIPDVYWVTIFGLPYVDMFSRELLLSCSAYRVEELANGAILLQLTERLDDIFSDQTAFESLRKNIREHLGADAFFDPLLPKKQKARVPVIDLFAASR